MYDFFARGDQYLKEVNRDHAVSGALRSGEGSSNSLAARVQLFEESERLDDIEETGEIVDDMHLQDELFKRYQKRSQK